MDISQIHFHKSTLEAISPRSFQDSSPVSLPSCLWKRKECAGYLSLWQTASLCRGQRRPEIRESSESVLGIDVKRNSFSDNFRTKSNWKINHPPSEVRKRRPGREKIPHPVLHTETGWQEREPGLARPLSLQEQSPGQTTKALSGVWETEDPEFPQLHMVNIMDEMRQNYFNA